MNELRRESCSMFRASSSLLDVTVLHHFELALRALSDACERHRVARAERDAGTAHASAVEAVWWVCALDEQFEGGNDLGHATAYEKARDSDASGAGIRGLRWVRDRHSHQLLLSTDFDDRAFFDSSDGSLFYLSRGFYWRPAEQLEAQAASYRTTRFLAGKKASQGRAAYDQHISGRTSSGPLHSAQTWLTAVVAGHRRLSP